MSFAGWSEKLWRWTGQEFLTANDQLITGDSLGVLTSFINKYKYTLIQTFLSS